MHREDFFDLSIARMSPGEAVPAEADVACIPEPSRAVVETRLADGWFYKPCYVTYVLRVPGSLDRYIEDAFHSGTRNKPRKLLRQVPERYALSVEEDGSSIADFKDLYRRTIVSRPRGRDRVAEHDDGFLEGWVGFYLREGPALVAGILVHELRDHLSVAYGAFDPAHRGLDLEHFLIMQAIDRCVRRRLPALSLGMDTNRYGHHLALGLPAYKLRIGFTPLAWEPAGRELIKIQHFDRFERGLFFYSYQGRGIVGNLFTRGEPDLRPFRHHNAPEIRTFRIPGPNGSEATTMDGVSV
ncbi:MAG TPA: GNAT family N-acetyltransferase [Planctomycetota bacterium]|nr:GNAT family N-acetyltransferase [Planctomycetota bacterium]